MECIIDVSGLFSDRHILITGACGGIGRATVLKLAEQSASLALADVDIEAVRFTVEPESEMAGRQVKKLARKLKRGSIFGVVVRGDNMLLPNGETAIEDDDHVIMITRHKNLPSLAKLFKGRS